MILDTPGHCILEDPLVLDPVLLTRPPPQSADSSTVMHAILSFFPRSPSGLCSVQA